MRVSVQNNVDIFRRLIRRNMNEANPDSVPFQIERERPIEIAVAISAHDRHRRANGFNRMQDAGRADIAEVPDFIRARRQRFQIRGHLIVRVGEDEYLHLGRWTSASINCVRGRFKLTYLRVI